MKKLGLFLMVMLFTASVSMAQNNQRNYDPAEVAKKQTAELDKLLDLDDKQEKKVYELNLAAANSMKKARQEMQAGGNRDELRSKMKKQREAHNAEMKKVLSESQYKKYLAQQEENRKKMQQRRGGGGQR